MSNASTSPFDFVKNLWGMPTMMMPKLSAEDLEKQIADLKIVESWLNLNVNMLRATIQTLEMQRTAISTFQSMSDTLGAAAKSAAATANSAANSSAAHSSSTDTNDSATTTAPKDEKANNGKTVDENISMANPTNPIAWLNLMQEQFQQVMNNVASTTAASAASTSTSTMPPDSTASTASTNKADVAGSAAKSGDKSIKRKPAGNK